jgi:hypothetical protein
MADIQTQLPIKITDGTNTAAVLGSSSLKVDGSGVTQPVSGTLTSVPSGTQTVTGTVTLSSQTVTIGATSVTQPVSGTVTNVPSGTQAVSGTVTNVPSGTQAVSGTVTNVPSGTQTVTGTVSTNAETNIAPGTAPSKAFVSGMVYNTAAPAPTNGQTLALQSDSAGNLKVAGSLTTTPSGTQAVSGTVTTVPSGTQTVTGTVTLSSQTVTIGATTVTQPVSGTVTAVVNAETNIAPGVAPSKAFVVGAVYNTTPPSPANGQTLALQADSAGNLEVNIAATSVTQPVSGTVTNVPSGTQAVSGTVTNVPSGTQTVTGTITNVPSGTQAVSGTVTNVPSGTQTVAGTITAVQSGTYTVVQGANSSVTVVPETTGAISSYATSATIAAASTGTLSYTVTVGKTLYWKGIIASSSGGPCKVTVDYGAGPTTVFVGFYSSASPFLNVTFPQPLIITATTVCNIKIQNNAGASQDVYGTFFGAEH